MSAWVALFYSIILGRGRRVVMSDLRDMAEELGLKAPRTLVATGNLIFEAERASPRSLERRLEPAFDQRFGRHIDIIVRSGEDWKRLVEANPFRAEAEAAPRSVHVRVMRAPLASDVEGKLEAYRTGDERAAVVGGDLWLYLPHGAGRSRLAAAVTPQRFGVGTFRNWNTARRIGAMLDH